MRSSSIKRTLLDDMEDFESSLRGDLDDPDLPQRASLVISRDFHIESADSDEDEDDSLYEMDEGVEDALVGNIFPNSKLPQVEEEDRFTDDDEEQDEMGVLPGKSKKRSIQNAGYEESVLQKLHALMPHESSSSFADKNLPNKRHSLTSSQYSTSSFQTSEVRPGLGGSLGKSTSVLNEIDDDDEMIGRRRATFTGNLEASSRYERRNTYERGEENISPRKSLVATMRSSVIGRKLTQSLGPGAVSMRDSSSSTFKLERVSNRPSEFGRNSNSIAAAAAAVQASQTTRRIQFGQGEYVLVQLSRLTLSEETSDKDLITIAPVNKYGYPAGEGIDRQKLPPHYFVLCVVVKVHFDEDERYYTVRRLDTEVEQRADPGFDWMEPIKNPDDIAVALKAAKRCMKTLAENQNEEKAIDSLCWKLFAYPLDYLQNVVIPFYKSFRNSAKVLVVKMLHGEKEFAFDIHVTGINVLVLFSFIFLFITPITFSFQKAKHDDIAAIIGFVTWTVLFIELIFEYIIRPFNYNELMQSDKAFSPATARHLNWFHFCCELLALALFVPLLPCAFVATKCGRWTPVSPVGSALNSVTNPDNWKAAAGRFLNGLSFLRAFALVRHWKQMWINKAFDTSEHSSFVHRLFFVEQSKQRRRNFLSIRKKKEAADDESDTTTDESRNHEVPIEQSNVDDKQLKDAATIGTALMVVNSHRALCLVLLICSVFPVIYSLDVRNPVNENMFQLLQANNVLANTSFDCDYLKSLVFSWLKTVTVSHKRVFDNSTTLAELNLQWAQVLPVRCEWQGPYGVLTNCTSSLFPACHLWSTVMPVEPQDATSEYFSNKVGVRPGSLVAWQNTTTAPAFFGDTTSTFVQSENVSFFVKVIFNESKTVQLVNEALLMRLVFSTALVLIGLTLMREDAGRLVLGPLQRMLKIVVRYAENPLSTPDSTKEMNSHDSKEQLGHFETEQLINAIAKIADLLRKCWGVAGAGIISANLARTKSGKTVVFNPTIPGKRVYALFGFVAINEFGKQLRSLDKDVMKLINDVARVVHDEVYRWALGDSGQCNKNLGGAFLMVFRIGDFTEVHARKQRATDVVFNTQTKKGVKVRQRVANSNLQRRRGNIQKFDVTSDGTLQLASLPGIQAFTDRALLGFLKSFAGLHRDQNMQKWEKDFRLSAGVGKFTINVIYGMDAGWAVEGAVGSEYKIDATYLSPHVNMASRMMSACKQYGVTLLMSQSVEELLSKPARQVMRHLDTVYVKGSNVAQRIYTFDARFVGVDFFLFERSPEQADVEADAYSPSIWTIDQDLKSMRQHVSDEFHDLFKKGVDQYVEGEWEAAIKTLKDADYLMLKTVVEEGYVDYDYDEIDENDLLDMSKTNFEIDRIRNQYGDGACKCLVQYMQRRDGIAPADWHGVRKLDSK